MRQWDMREIKQIPQEDAVLIGKLLRRQVIYALAREGIHTIEDIKANYPKQLLKVRGFGFLSLRRLELELFKEPDFTPYQPRHIVREEKISSATKNYSKAIE